MEYILGFTVHTFCIEAPGRGVGKTLVNPHYIVSLDEKHVVSRNYQGKIYTYPNPDR
jgi:lysine 2,3-aminomutase